jgi:hypothetical protein
VLISLSKWVGCLVLVMVMGHSCIWEGEVIEGIPVEKAPEETEKGAAALGDEWLLSRVSETLQDILANPLVHVTAEEKVRVYRETWGEETPHVDILYGDYVLRLPLEEIAGYPWQAVVEQLETDVFGPVELTNGWQLWLGDQERANAISYDLSIAVRDTCAQLSASGEKQRDEAVQSLCDDFRRGFAFDNDLELYRRLWRSSFDAAVPWQGDVNDALATLFLADLKRLIAPPPAEEHVAEVQTRWMRGFEFGDDASPEGVSAELFDERNHVTVLFLRPEEESEPLDKDFRQKVLASVRRHGQWVPGLDMIHKAEEILKTEELDNGTAAAMLLLFSSLQFPDHRTRVANMLVKLVTEVAPEEEGIMEGLKAIARGEGRQ